MFRTALFLLTFCLVCPASARAQDAQSSQQNTVSRPGQRARPPAIAEQNLHKKRLQKAVSAQTAKSQHQSLPTSHRVSVTVAPAVTALHVLPRQTGAEYRLYDHRLPAVSGVPPPRAEQDAGGGR